jgi:hypothetical protein
MHQINVVYIHLPPTFNSLPLPFPCISTLSQATDLSEEETSTTDTDIDDYILTPLGQHKQKSMTLTSSRFSVATRS